MMKRNLILEEIYAARDKLLADYNGDVHASVLAARERALASGRPIAHPNQRTIRSGRGAESDDTAATNCTSPTHS